MKKNFLKLFIIVMIFMGVFFALKERSERHLLASLVEIEISTINQWRINGGLTKAMNRGSVGVEVRLLQYFLANVEDNDFSHNLITGYYGEETSRAVYKWQEENDLTPTGMVDSKTRKKINEVYYSNLCPSSSGEYSSKKLAPIGKDIGLPKDYVPKDLVDITDRVKTIRPMCLTKEAAMSLEEMFEDAKEEGIVLAVTSGFRRNELQDIIHRSYIELRGNKAKDFSARPGHSEHQLGTAVDLTGESVSFRPVPISFGNTPEKKWLKKNAHKYGFVLSYPKDKKEITGYIYEPWHWRFVGKEHAEKIKNSNLTSIEYLRDLEKRSVDKKIEEEKKTEEDKKAGEDEEKEESFFTWGRVLGIIGHYVNENIE